MKLQFRMFEDKKKYKKYNLEIIRKKKQKNSRKKSCMTVTVTVDMYMLKGYQKIY